MPAAYTFLPISEFPWLLPGRPEVAGYFFDWVQHSNRDSYWKQWSIRDRWQDVDVPVLNLGGWYDIFLQGTIQNFIGMLRHGRSEFARNNSQLVIRPYAHLPWTTKVGEVEFGPEAANNTAELQLRWFDHWLKGRDNGVEHEPAVRLFVMGANRWREASEWPVPGTRFTRYYFHSRGQANSAYGNGTLSTVLPGPDENPDRYVYDPARPVPSRGGHSCCLAEQTPMGPYDQSDIESRADVLVYSTPALTSTRRGHRANHRGSLCHLLGTRH